MPELQLLLREILSRITCHPDNQISKQSITCVTDSFLQVKDPLIATFKTILRLPFQINQTSTKNSGLVSILF